MLVRLTEDHLRLPSCLATHAQLRPQLRELTPDIYVQTLQQMSQSHLYGIVRDNTQVLAIAVYRTFPTTFDTVRFEIDDLIVDINERNRGLGTQLYQYLLDQAKQHQATSILVHCDPNNTDAHRFLFRLGFTITVYGFYSNQPSILEENDRIAVRDITDEENDEFLLKSQDVHRQLRPHLPEDPQAYRDQIRDICRTGPARILIALDRTETNEVLGLAVYRITSNLKYGQHLYCDDLVSREDRRSFGVGRCLINAMKKQGYTLNLDSGCQRGRAHRFYYREGLKIDQFGFTLKF